MKCTYDSFRVDGNGVNDSKVNVANGGSNDKSKVGKAALASLDWRADKVSMVSPKHERPEIASGCDLGPGQISDAGETARP